MASEQSQTTNGADLLSLKAAADRLDLPHSFLSWAVEGGFLQACRNAKGDWCLPAGEIEAGLRALQEEQANSKSARLEAAEAQTPRPNVNGGGRARLQRDSGRRVMPDPSLRASDMGAGAETELDHLRALIKAQQASIDAKDNLIADLARQMGKVSELALARLPVAATPDEK